MSAVRGLRRPRHLHPGAWWLWAIGLAAAAGRTTNPLLLLLVAAVAGYVVAARRTAAPWARSYATFLRLGAVVVAIRVTVQVLFGTRTGSHLLVRLPEVELPAWAANVRVGGPVTAEGLLSAAYDGLRLAVLLACFGAANSLASPYRLLRAMPGALYEAGVAVTVALSFAPQAIVSVGAVREARRLRGRPASGVRGVRGLAVPVLEGAFERAVDLAAAMDSRGYGRRRAVPPALARTATVTTLAGLLAVCAGVYGLLDLASPAALGLPMLAVGALLLAVGLAVAGRRTTRTRYRPDPWRGAEWLVAGSGLLAFAGLVAAGAVDADGLHPTTVPLTAPGLPVLAGLGVAAALLPAWAAPVPE